MKISELVTLNRDLHMEALDRGITFDQMINSMEREKILSKEEVKYLKLMQLNG